MHRSRTVNNGIVVVKHKENIGRLLKGTESKFSFKKSVKTAEEKNEEKN